MKRIIFLIALMFAVAAISEAQIATLQMAPTQTYIEYTTNVTLTSTTPQYFLVYSQAPYYTAQAYVVQLDSVSGNHTNMAVAISGRVSDQTSTWTAIGSTINWTGSSDTTIIFLNATENQYRQFKILFTGTGTGVSRIDNFEFKQYYGTP